MTGKSDFKIIPGGDELAQVERDLRFHPASSTNLEKLTPDEIASFNRNGYLKSLRVFEANEITDIRAYFDRLLSEALANGADSYSISSGSSEAWSCVRHSVRLADRRLRQGSSWRQRDRVGFTLLLQDAARRQACGLAPRCQLLAARSFEDRHRVARD